MTRSVGRTLSTTSLGRPKVCPCTGEESVSSSSRRLILLYSSLKETRSPRPWRGDLWTSGKRSPKLRSGAHPHRWWANQPWEVQTGADAHDADFGITVNV